MPLEMFDSTKKLEYFAAARAPIQIPTSAVGLVDLPKETRVEIRYGAHDQDMGENLYALLAVDEIITPEDQNFEKVCGLLWNLRLPRVYRKERTGENRGYPILVNDLYHILTNAKTEFVGLLLDNFEAQHDAYGKLQCYNGADVVFKKVKNDTPPKIY